MEEEEQEEVSIQQLYNTIAMMIIIGDDQRAPAAIVGAPEEGRSVVVIGAVGSPAFDFIWQANLPSHTCETNSRLTIIIMPARAAGCESASPGLSGRLTETDEPTTSG